MIGQEHKARIAPAVAATSRACVICGGARDCSIGEEPQTVCKRCIEAGRRAQEVRGIAYTIDTLLKIARCNKTVSCGKCRIAAETLVREVGAIAIALGGACRSCGDDRDHPIYCKTCVKGFLRMQRAGEPLPEDVS